MLFTKKNNSGQALIILLVFMVISISITSAAVIMIVANSEASSSLEQSMVAHQLAESGAENALVRLLRNTAYTGETMTINTYPVTITVTGTTTKTIRSQAKVGNFIRTIELSTTYTNSILTITSWKDTY